MEATRKNGGFAFDVMPMVASTAQKLTDLLKIMKDGDTLTIKQVQSESQPSEAPQKKK